MNSVIRTSKPRRYIFRSGIALGGLICLQAFSPRLLRATDWSTLFTAQDVRDHLGTPEGREQALSFCRRMGLKKVYIEAFRDERGGACIRRGHIKSAATHLVGPWMKS